MAAGPLRVYGWLGFRAETQTREIVAARSMAEAVRLAGFDRPSEMFNLAETRNERDVAVAMTDPWVVYWRPLDSVDAPYVSDRPAKPRGGST